MRGGRSIFIKRADGPTPISNSSFQAKFVFSGSAGSRFVSIAAISPLLKRPPVQKVISPSTMSAILKTFIETSRKDKANSAVSPRGLTVQALRFFSRSYFVRHARGPNPVANQAKSRQIFPAPARDVARFQA